MAWVWHGVACHMLYSVDAAQVGIPLLCPAAATPRSTPTIFPETAAKHAFLPACPSCLVVGRQPMPGGVNSLRGHPPGLPVASRRWRFRSPHQSTVRRAWAKCLLRILPLVRACSWCRGRRVGFATGECSRRTCPVPACTAEAWAWKASIRVLDLVLQTAS